MSLLEKLVVALVVAAAVLIFRDVAFSGRHQWDFKSYHAAGRAVAGGLNPYDLDDLNSVAEHSTLLPFLYSPPSLPFFIPFAPLSYSSATVIWACIKFLSLASLLWLWFTFFVAREHRTWFALFCLLGLNGALYADLSTGNVAVIEQLLLWTGIVLLLKHKSVSFVLCVIAASLLKITPLWFLILVPLLTTDRIRSKKTLVIATGVIVGLCAACLLFVPSLTEGFVRGILETGRGSRADRGIINPAILALIRDVVERLPSVGTAGVSKMLSWGLYGSWVATVCFFSWRAFARMKATAANGEDFARDVVMLCCLTYVLIVPRFKNYSYVLAVLPVFLAIVRCTRLTAGHLLLVVAMLSTGSNSWLPGFRTGLWFLWDYYPLAIVAGAWMLVLSEARAGSPAASQCLPGEASP